MTTFVGVFSRAAEELEEKTPSSFYDQQIKSFWQKGTDQESIQVLLAGTAVTLLTRPQDDQTYASWNNEQKMSSSAANFGDYLGSGVPGVLIVGLQYWLDAEASHAEAHLRSLVWGTVIVQGMKFSVGRNRPGESEDRHSFPSGHTMTSFATATSLTYAYGWKAAVIAYPMAAFVGASRLAKGTHWLSDVVAGAFLGYWVGRAGFYEYQIKNQKIIFSPALNPESVSLNLLYSF